MRRPVILATHWGDGGKGAAEVARAVVELIEQVPANFKFVYDDDMPLWDKVKTIATKIYGAGEVTADSKVRDQIKKLQEDGYGHYPVCVAKTQYSFSTDPQLRGAPRADTRSTSARCGSPLAPSSSSWCAATS